jgi:hypothetical protein
MTDTCPHGEIAADRDKIGTKRDQNYDEAVQALVPGKDMRVPDVGYYIRIV